LDGFNVFNFAKQKMENTKREKRKKRTRTLGKTKEFLWEQKRGAYSKAAVVCGSVQTKERGLVCSLARRRSVMVVQTIVRLGRRRIKKLRREEKKRAACLAAIRLDQRHIIASSTVA
jgi:hypothetical protein